MLTQTTIGSLKTPSVPSRALVLSKLLRLCNARDLVKVPSAARPVVDSLLGDFDGLTKQVKSTQAAHAALVAQTAKKTDAACSCTCKCPRHDSDAGHATTLPPPPPPRPPRPLPQVVEASSTSVASKPRNVVPRRVTSRVAPLPLSPAPVPAPTGPKPIQAKVVGPSRTASKPSTTTKTVTQAREKPSTLTATASRGKSNVKPVGLPTPRRTGVKNDPKPVSKLQIAARQRRAGHDTSKEVTSKISAGETRATKRSSPKVTTQRTPPQIGSEPEAAPSIPQAGARIRAAFLAGSRASVQRQQRPTSATAAARSGAGVGGSAQPRPSALPQPRIAFVRAPSVASAQPRVPVQPRVAVEEDTENQIDLQSTEVQEVQEDQNAQEDQEDQEGLAHEVDVTAAAACLSVIAPAYDADIRKRADDDDDDDAIAGAEADAEADTEEEAAVEVEAEIETEVNIDIDALDDRDENADANEDTRPRAEPQAEPEPEPEPEPQPQAQAERQPQLLAEPQPEPQRQLLPLAPRSVAAPLTIDDIDYFYEEPIANGTYGSVFFVHVNADITSFRSIWGYDEAVNTDLVTPMAMKKMMLETDVDSDGGGGGSEMRSGAVAEKTALLSIPPHPMMIKLYSAFDDDNNGHSYLLMEFAVAGDLQELRCAQPDQVFQEDDVRGLVACILLGLQHIHASGFVHRDVKLENLVMGEDERPKFIDFGFAKKLEHGHRTLDRCGTCLYLAPELVPTKYEGEEQLPDAQGFERAVDLWAFGALVYEMLVGTTPFQVEHDDDADDAAKDYATLLSWRKITDYGEGLIDLPFPEDVSPEARDLICQLLARDPKCRLGMSSDEEVRSHPWFEGVDWAALLVDEEPLSAMRRARSKPDQST